MLVREIINGGNILETSKKSRVPNKYLGATEKVAPISPVLTGKWGKKQGKLMNKFFGSS